MCVITGCGVSPVTPTHDIVSLVSRTVSAQCPTTGSLPPATTMLQESPINSRGQKIGIRKRIATEQGHELIIERIVINGQLRRLSVEFLELTKDGLRPVMHTSTRPDCVIRMGRRLYYKDSGLLDALEYLDADLNPVGAKEPLNPDIPPGDDPGGVRVGLVDSGVNYLLPEIYTRLARDKEGRPLGYDYWDGDPFPLDSQAVPSAFYPRHHGTRPASIILREAPASQLVPYRYPRPDMTRMKDLVNDAARKGVKIMNLSMGSYKYHDWKTFESAAKQYPELLFVVSAGNNGHDIDERPVYPAALELDNMITVTSADDHGGLARGSNWGKKSVDLSVPGENLIAMDHDGRRGLVSGTTYAAARVTALAARLLDIHPNWTAAELKNEISKHASNEQQFVGQRLAVGEIADPFKLDMDDAIKKIKQKNHYELIADEIYQDKDLAKGKYLLQPNFILLEKTGWDENMFHSALRQMATILSQCDIAIPRINVYLFDVPERYKDFHSPRSNELAGAIGIGQPTIFFIRDSLQKIAFDASTFGKSNIKSHTELQDTIWVLSNARDLGISLAHELVHVLLDSGVHTHAANNLMQENTSKKNIQLSTKQCRAIIDTGLVGKLLVSAK